MHRTEWGIVGIVRQAVTPIGAKTAGYAAGAILACMCFCQIRQDRPVVNKENRGIEGFWIAWCHFTHVEPCANR